jgi:flagellar assembly protein FliH
MAKHVFRPAEIVNLTRKVYIEPPRPAEAAVEPAPPALGKTAAAAGEPYEGPTVEEVRREAEEFRAGWAHEKEQMVAEARAEAERIVKEAEQVAFDEVRRKNDQAKKVRQEAEDQARAIVEQATQGAARIEQEARDRVAALEKETSNKGFEEGRAAGFAAGEAEVKRLVERLHVVLTSAIEKRNQIIEESESQLINLVLQISQKVIKVLSENQKNVVINNVIQALRKLKGRGEVVIRVNLADLELTTQHTQDFLKSVENVKSIAVLEDSTVDKGGCVIETDFGEIDARISSQLQEIEERILELAPIRTKSG